MFNARDFVARQFDCRPEAFTMVRKPLAGYRGQEADYAGDSAVVRVLVSNRRGAMVRGEQHTQADLHRRVQATWRGGHAETRIGVDEEVVW